MLTFRHGAGHESPCPPLTPPCPLSPLMDRWTLLALVVLNAPSVRTPRSEEHTSELQSHSDLVCRLLLEKKKTMVTAGDVLAGNNHLEHHELQRRATISSREHVIT